MRCPKCDVYLQAQTDRGVVVQACPNCKGLWLTPAELDQLEDEAFDDDADKGSLFIVSRATGLKCPVCQSSLRRFNYRFYDLELDCCPEHGFWLDAGEDARVLELMREEKEHVQTKFGLEDSWASYIRRLQSPSFFEKVKDLFRK